MDYSTIFIFLVVALRLQGLEAWSDYDDNGGGEVSDSGPISGLSSDAEGRGVLEGRGVEDTAPNSSFPSDSDAAASGHRHRGGYGGHGGRGGRERILGPRLISHVQAQHNGLVPTPAPQPPQPQAFGTRLTPRPPGDPLHAIPVRFVNTPYKTGGEDPVNVYPVHLPATHPVVASLDKNEAQATSGVITGYPVIVHIPEQNQPIAVYRGQFPSFIERIVQRIQNRYSVYNPPDYFENRPRPEIELLPPDPPLCVEAGEGRNETQEGYAYAPPCPVTSTTTPPPTVVTEPPPTVPESYVNEVPKHPENATVTVFNGTIILINCTDLQEDLAQAPYIYVTPSTTTTTPTPPSSSEPYIQETFQEAPHEGELYLIPPRATSSPPPPPPSLYLPPATEPPAYYLPPETTTTTTTTTSTLPPSTYPTSTTPKPSTPGPGYLPPETPPPSTPAPSPSTPARVYLPPETTTTSTPAPSTLSSSTPARAYLPPETPAHEPVTPVFAHILPDPAPVYLPPQPPAPSYSPPSQAGQPSYSVNTGKGQGSQQVPHVNININGYQQANQLQPLLPFPLRLIQLKKLLIAKLLHLN